jgi:hypothetical protein
MPGARVQRRLVVVVAAAAASGNFGDRNRVSKKVTD